MIIFVCKTCERKFPAEIAYSKIIYMDSNKRIDLIHEDDDCETCKNELDEITATAREKAREELRAKNKAGEPTF